MAAWEPRCTGMGLELYRGRAWHWHTIDACRGEMRRPCLGQASGVGCRAIFGAMCLWGMRGGGRRALAWRRLPLLPPVRSSTQI
eukprot:scaffold9712_cov108-Isochrysis_galbana.AAC.1